MSKEPPLCPPEDGCEPCDILRHAPHDSTRCKMCGNVYDDGTCGYPIHKGRIPPLEPVGAVDAEKAEQYAKYALESNLYAHQEHFPNLARAYLAVTEGMRRLNEEIDAVGTERDTLRAQLAALARATPAEGSQYATTAELYNELANELDETRTTEDIARLTAAIHALDPKNPPPIPTTPPRSPATVTEAQMTDAPVHYDHEQACAWADGWNSCRAAIAPNGVTVTDQMVERATQTLGAAINATGDRPLSDEDINAAMRDILTAALGGRDAE
jgi:hypothetical protein